MLSYNSCSLTAWSWHYDFQTSCSLGYWFLVGSGSPGLRGEMLQVPSGRQRHQLQTQPCWTHFCLDRETLASHTPSQVSQFNTQTQRQKHFHITTQQSWKKDMTKPHLSLGSSFKRCFAVWWKMPNCITAVQHFQCCINSSNAKI